MKGIVSVTLLLVLVGIVTVCNGQTRCIGRLQNWVDSTSNWYTATNNWNPRQFPEIFEYVRLHTDTSAAPTYTVTLDTNATVSSLDVGVGAKITVTNNAYLLLENHELTCFEVNWCYNHGVCTGINECQCDAGYSGADCSIQTTPCPNNQVRDNCGVCGGDDSSCTCQDFAGVPTEQVSTLLLAYTNGLIASEIMTLMEELETIKTVASFYDPNTMVLNNQLRLYLVYLQNFCTVCLEQFYRDNAQFLREISNGLTTDYCS